ncbi:MAG: ABC transporter ATP-binding protein [Acidobacteriota bacterium]|nr:ABC transporter ATP-binding protein [Acidobacteriota bacterium]
MEGVVEATEAPSSDGAESGTRRPIVAIEHVTKSFDGVVAVDDLNLEVLEGEFFSLLGPSGCGKTTTLRMLGGFEEPTSGRIFLGGKEVTYLAPYRRDVNTVFQSYALFPHLSVFENVAFGLKRKHIDRADIHQRVTSILEIVDLPKMESRKTSQLSGGQQQRVALARALVNHPKLLLLDEPMSALDAKLRHQMQIELKRIQREVGITFLYVTHDQEEAMTMSDRLVVMRHGRIEGIGTPRDVYDNPSTEFVATFLGASNLLTGSATSEGAGVASVRLTNGAVVRVPTDRLPEHRAGTEVKVGVRPEKITISTGAPDVSADANSLTGRVRVSTFTGVGNQYLVEMPWGTDLTVYAQNIGQASAPRSGDEVTLTWPVEHTFAVRPMADGAVQNDSAMEGRDE